MQEREWANISWCFTQNRVLLSTSTPKASSSGSSSATCSTSSSRGASEEKIDPAHEPKTKNKEERKRPETRESKKKSRWGEEFYEFSNRITNAIYKGWYNDTDVDIFIYAFLTIQLHEQLERTVGWEAIRSQAWSGGWFLFCLIALEPLEPFHFPSSPKLYLSRGPGDKGKKGFGKGNLAAWKL